MSKSLDKIVKDLVARVEKLEAKGGKAKTAEPKKPTSKKEK